jgi:hypothetical protein
MFELGSVFRVVLGGVWEGVTPFSNTYQIYLTAGNSPFTFQEIVTQAGEWAQGVVDEIVALQNEIVSWTYYSVATLDDDDRSGNQPLPSGPTAGEVVGTPLPSQTTLQARFPTGHSRRILKKAFNGLSEADTGNSGNYGGTAQAAWLVFAAGLVPQRETTEGSWLYCYSNTAPVVAGSLVFPNSVGINPVPNVQRRRRTG